MKKVFLVLLVIVLVLLGFMCKWTDGNLDWIVSKIAGAPRDVPMWLSVIATFLLNGLALAFNVIVYIVRIIIV